MNSSEEENNSEEENGSEDNSTPQKTPGPAVKLSSGEEDKIPLKKFRTKIQAKTMIHRRTCESVYNRLFWNLE